MAKSAAKVGDIGTDHDGFYPTAITAGSPDVFIDGIPAARVGDPLAPHDKPNNPPHPRKIASGSSTVFINGMPAALTGGAVDCGGVIIGSGTVVIGDQAPAARSARAAPVQQPVQPVEIQAQNAYWPPYDFAQGKTLEVVYTTAPTDIAVLSFEEAKELLQTLYSESGGKDTVGTTKSYHDLIDGVKTAAQTAKGLGGFGVISYTKNIKGIDYVIIKNYRRHAQTLMKGNKWKASNPRVVQIGIGLNDVKGAARWIKINAGVEIAFAVGVNAADYVLRDEATLAEFIGNSSSDIIKGMTTLVTMSLVVATLPVSGILVTGALFAFGSFFMGRELDALDERYGFSDEIGNSLKRLVE
ncbi:type VI secretion system PAAR protein [Aeromonas sp. FDAARGOS 1405]|uniref:type VI secretion system PAAR protein n=2 Tax=Aeromonas TaxID=642 RepID=UPI0020B33984|nr:type VI secretion system PAAR protein [Aeromonas sp. FDAARGOS 1405]